MGKIYTLRYRKFLIFSLLILLVSVTSKAQEVRKLTFDGKLSEQKVSLNDFNPALPSDWSVYTHLVLEMKTSSPQRFSVWLSRTNGKPVRVMFQPFGQNVWLRACIPLQYFIGMDKSGNDLASAINRRTNSFWFSVWGPFGKINAIDSVTFTMEYPINKPTLELRAVHLSTKDEGSEFLEGTPVLDEFNQWAHADWPGKIKSKEQLIKELADEEKTFGKKNDYNYSEFGGYKNTQVKATGFFRVEKVDSKWWFVDPKGHLFLSTGSNGAGAGFGGRAGGQGRPANAGTTQPPTIATATSTVPVSTTVNPANARITPRLKAWGMTTGGLDMAYTVMLRWPRSINFLGLPDVYSEEFARGIDQSANTQCAALKDDPYVLGYFVGNEPAFENRESEVVDMILAGAVSATQTKLKEFLAQGDTPKRRKEFIITAFEKYLELTCSAVKKYDPNHLTLGIRFGGSVSEELLHAASIFDVCSINVYEYEAKKQLERASQISGRPTLIGEFHIGVPADGLGAGLVQAKNQKERGIAYRYFMEQGASVSSFLGAYWFQWRDEPVLGRMDGENYNIGFVDVTDRPYKELVEAAKLTNKRLYEVHSGKIPPFNQRPLASDAGTPLSPWSF